MFQPEEVVIDYLVMNASCEENNDGSISTNVSGGTLPYAYLWSNGDFTSDLNNLSKEMNFKVIYPNTEFCGDNAAMIAWAGIKRFKKDLFDDLDISVKSRWPLDETAPFMKGPGLRLG